MKAEKIMLNRKSPLPILGIFLISVGILVLEISLTRIFSVILTHHYVFVVISFAILGLGLGGIIFYKIQKIMLSIISWISISAILFSISIPVTVYLLIKLPLLEGTGFTKLSFYIYVLLSTIPFVLAGIVLAAFFREYPKKASLIYGADLLGAGIGAILAWILLQNYGGVGAALFSGAIAGSATLFLSFNKKKILLASSFSFISATFFLLLFFFSAFFPEVPIGTDFDKDLYRVTNNKKMKVEIIESKWSAFGRTDVVRVPGNPHELWLFIDGAAGTPMFHFSGTFTDSNAVKIIKDRTLQFFPFLFLKPEEKDNALIIGPGGGKDVLVAILGGVKDITAVEVNPDIVYLVNKYSDFNGGIYQRFPSVKLIVEEGRQFVRNSKEKYDLIMLAIPIIKSKRGFEGYTLTEDYLFTKEAFEDYLEHLTPEGRIIVLGHGKLEALRLISTALKALESEGKDNAEGMLNIYTVSDGSVPLFVLKKSRFTREEVEMRHKAMHLLNYNLPIAFFPYVEQSVLDSLKIAGIPLKLLMFNRTLVDLAKGVNDVDSAFRGYPADVSPAYDDKPFFYDFNRGLPRTVLTLFFIFLVLLIILIWRSGIRKDEFDHDHRRDFHILIKRAVYIFSLLGMGYMAAEISMFQKLILFFKHPSLALSILLATLLVGTGTGSLFSLKVSERKTLKSLQISTILAFFLLSAFIFLISIVKFSSNFSSQILIISFLFITGISMGFPFPLLIRYSNKMGLKNKIPWFWGINGVSSVVGSTAAVIIAKSLGWSFSLGIAALSYIIVTLIALNLKKKELSIKEIKIYPYTFQIKRSEEEIT